MREELSSLMHEMWSGWMRHLFSKSIHDPEDGTLIVPAWGVVRWWRQMHVPYDQLSEEEKDSDRREADKVLALIKKCRGGEVMLSDERIWELIEHYTGIVTDHRPTAIVSVIRAAVAESAWQQADKVLALICSQETGDRCVCPKCGQAHDPKLVYGGLGQESPQDFAKRMEEYPTPPEQGGDP